MTGYNSTEDIATELSTILKQSEDLIANKYLAPKTSGAKQNKTSSQNSHRTVLPSSSQNTRKSVLPSSSQNSRKSVPPSSSQNSSKSVLPSSSQNSRKSVLPSSSQNSRKSVLPSSSQNSRKSALSSLSEENQKKRNIVDQEIIDMVSGLNIYNVQIIDMKEVDRVSCYYPQEKVYKSDSSDEEESVCCPGLRRRSPEKEEKDNSEENQESAENLLENTISTISNSEKFTGEELNKANSSNPEISANEPNNELPKENEDIDVSSFEEPSYENLAQIVRDNSEQELSVGKLVTLN
ncbi:hypothetical protein CDAR_39621 [Caerostris darwini]|uniref:Uncharacterized protein n=1 Tax=Caerostris darwini TaxID=1538125 RepID=A0AAV4U698_9ARAC|nr:hypothetical protein CDAR_39621 [Caerostris darwini]